jgi:transcriptional regulator with XRE-family HTH domain
MANLPQAFRSRRIARGLSLARAAAEAGVSPRTVSYFEAGEHDISLENARRLLAVVGLDLRTAEAVHETLPVVADEPARAKAKPKARGRTHARPASLSQAARRGRAEGRRDAMIREFCDEFYKATTAARRRMLASAPPLQGDEADAYYAAIAEHLSLQNGLPVPAWALAEQRFLRKPFFPAGLQSLKSTLLVESPVAFRRRMVFVGANPLSRPPRSL